jgi:hypothetical protein
MALDDEDMTTAAEPPDSGTPADAAKGTMPEAEYMGSGGDDGGADGGADAGARSGTGDAAGGNDPTTDADEDSRFA